MVHPPKTKTVRYDLSIEPIVAALRETVTRIAAQMVLVVAGSVTSARSGNRLGEPLNMIRVYPRSSRRLGHRPDVCALTIILLRLLV